MPQRLHSRPEKAAVNRRRIMVDIARQTLTLKKNGRVLRTYAISTATNGPGEQSGSGSTPRGRHVIRAMIGAGCAPGTVFVGRRPTGEIFSPDLALQFPQRDWILSRILWLCGTEPGKNRFGAVDTMRRYIYIHGCPDSEPMGVPASHGCIRMRNADIIELSGMLRPGTPVVIR